MKQILFIAAATASISLASCKKEPEPEITTPVATENLNKTILTDFTEHVALDVYGDLANRTATLSSNVAVLSGDLSDVNLTTCKQNWREARLAWEKSEAFLFGPVSTENIDPRIDTWPVNFQDLDGELAGSATFTQDYVNGLQDALKGFHPIEYLLFGQNGNKTADQLTARELEYLTALTENLKTLTGQLLDGWHTGGSDYANSVMTAGEGSSVYPTRVSAFEELVNGMIGICDEVANGKMAEPFLANNPLLEESPFAFNSITDFTNNIRGVEMVYLSKYTNDGVGLEDLVRKNNLQLDGAIKQAIANAVAALQNITVPFGQAISQQPVQVQNAIDAVNALAEVLESDLLPYVQQHGN